MQSGTVTGFLLDTALGFIRDGQWLVSWNRLSATAGGQLVDALGFLNAHENSSATAACSPSSDRREAKRIKAGKLTLRSREKRRRAHRVRKRRRRTDGWGSSHVRLCPGRSSFHSFGHPIFRGTTLSVLVCVVLPFDKEVPCRCPHPSSLASSSSLLRP